MLACSVATHSTECLFTYCIVLVLALWLYICLQLAKDNGSDPRCQFWNFTDDSK